MDSGGGGYSYPPSFFAGLCLKEPTVRKQKYDLSDYNPDQFDDWLEISTIKMLKRAQRKKAPYELMSELTAPTRAAGKTIQRRRTRSEQFS